MTNFGQLEERLRLIILQRMTMKSLCRLRQTCTSLDDFVEYHRFRIEVPSKEDLTFVISVDAFPNPQPQYHVLIGSPYNRDFRIGHQSGLEDYSRIDDPFNQLSAIRFDIVYMSRLHTDEAFNPARFYEDPEHVQRQFIVFRKKVLRTVRKMRIRCDRLIGEGFWEFPLILPYIRFSRLSMSGVSVTAADFIKLPTENCTELSIDDISDVPDSLLQEIIAPNSNIRNLQSLKLFTTAVNRNDDDIDLPGTVKLWRGKPHCLMRRLTGNNYTFYKTPLVDGVALIFKHRDVFQLSFYKTDSREILFECFYPEMFLWIPYDCSFIIKEFLEAESDQAAFDILYSSYKY